MNRGTIVAVGGGDSLSPTFVDSGVHELLATTLMARYVQTHSPEVAAMLRQPWRRLLGDMAAIGKGEILYPSVAN
jgi:formylmethanofuran dehydrogenase subunit C